MQISLLFPIAFLKRREKMRHSVAEEALSQSNFYFPRISAPSQAYTSNGIPHLLKKIWLPDLCSLGSGSQLGMS